MVQAQSEMPTRPKNGLVVNFYPRTVAGTHSTWSDVCKLSGVLAETFPDAEFRCVVLHTMSVRVQLQLISEAVVHVWPHGNTGTHCTTRGEYQLTLSQGGHLTVFCLRRKARLPLC